MSLASLDVIGQRSLDVAPGVAFGEVVLPVPWLDDQTHLKPSTRERYAGILREYIQPKWGKVRLSDVSHDDAELMERAGIDADVLDSGCCGLAAASVHRRSLRHQPSLRRTCAVPRFARG